jgi:hypothetical protein
MPDAVDQRTPDPGSVLELLPTSRADALVGWSEGSDDDELIVSAPLDRSQRPVSLPIGEHLEVVWRAADELCALPAVLASVEVGERPMWRLRRAGVLRRGQRRDAVRAPLAIPVRLGPDAAPISGTSVDVSEGGLRCILDEDRPTSEHDAAVDPALPRTGDVVRVTTLFPDFSVTCAAEVTRLHDRVDPRLELSVRFIGLTENQQDDIRRRVFARLRELRHRGLL